MRIPAFVPLVLMSFCSFGQLKKLTFYASANYPLIRDQQQEPENNTVYDPYTGYTVTWLNIGSLKESYATKPGFDIGTTFIPYSSSKFFIKTGLGIQYFRYKRSISVVSTSETFSRDSLFILPGVGVGNIIGVPLDSTRIIGPWPSPQLPEADPRTGESTALYLQIPVVIGKSFFKNRLEVTLGISTSVLIRGTVYESVYEYSQNGNYYGSQMVTRKNTSSDGFTNLLINGIFQTTYLVNKHWGITVGFQHAFSAIYDSDSQFAGRAVYNNFSLGTSYRL